MKNKIYATTDLDGMREFIISSAGHDKQETEQRFDYFRAAEEYEQIIDWAVSLGAILK